jgi:hypothetical protein
VNNTSPQYIASNIGAVFAQLNQQDIEEFYIGYQRWNLQHQIEILQARLEDLRKQIIANTERMQELHPTAIEFATLARLQSNGVSDVDLLDRILERGESWLDRTMQRLDYFEQLDDFISDDYTQWCQHALEGAYDWIDSMLDGNSTSPPTAEATKEEELIEATEELFLQKISNEEDESIMLETTMKRPSITIADLEEAVPTTEDTRAAVEAAPTPENTTTVMEEANPAEEPPVEVTSIDDGELTVSQDFALFEEPVSVQEDTTLVQESVEVSPVTEESSASPIKTSLENVSPRRPNLIRRFLGKIWRS